MPFEILRSDITKMNVDAIINPSSIHRNVSDGVEFDIYQAAGPGLQEERNAYGVIKAKEAVLTKGFDLPARHVIHVASPAYKNGSHHETQALRQAYKVTLKLASTHQFESIAFPLIASGANRFPRGEALEVALSEIKLFLEKHEMMIYLVVYDEASYQVSLDRFNEVKNYLSDLDESKTNKAFFKMDLVDAYERPVARRISRTRRLSEIDLTLDETFISCLFRLIDESDLTDVDVYKKANIDRKLFSKIKSNDDYQPSKLTVIAFSITLELNLDQTKDLLNKAGYSLSPSSKFDKIISYFIEDENYDLYEINQVLFAFEQKTIGGI